jgi:hypothetical protein
VYQSTQESLYLSPKKNVSYSTGTRRGAGGDQCKQ